MNWKNSGAPIILIFFLSDHDKNKLLKDQINSSANFKYIYVFFLKKLTLQRQCIAYTVTCICPLPSVLQPRNHC